MVSENIILQSAGSLSVALLALLMVIVQALFFVRKPQFTWYAWSAAISFSALLYSIGIFLEYNTPQGPINRFSGLLEWTAIIFSIHCLYGFTFSYLGIASKRYHPVAGACHGLILILLWSTNYLVADSFTAQDFLGLASPYIEPALGPLGPLFVLYAAAASVTAMIVWIRHKRTDPKHRVAYLAGMGVWILLGIHDGLASLGVPTLQYAMEYGFLGFAMAVLWVVFNNDLERAAEEKYRVITEFANDCIMVIQDGKMVFRNRACCDLIGRPLTGTAQRDFADILASEDRKAVLEHYNTLLEGGHVPIPHMVLIRRADGEQRFVEISSSLIQYRNRPAVLAIMRDITERKRTEEARLESERKFARLMKMESLGLLAGGVAHDLNNILSGVVSYPDLLLMQLPEDSPLRNPIAAIQKSGQKAAAIVQDFLTMAQRGVPTIELVDLNEIISEYLKSPECEKLRSYHPDVEIKLDLAGDLLNISGSKVHLSKTIMNLVSNAAEAMKEGGIISISTENRYIDRPIQGYELVDEGDYAILTVSDTGIGIPDEDRGRIFEPFYTKKKMGRSGTGLGMTVVWGTVKDHRGFIDLHSTEGEGTTFRLYFPATREKLEKKDTPLVSPKEYMGKGESILVVDDVAEQRDIASVILSELGYSVGVVSSGEEAIEYLKDHTADLLVLDMIMDPGIDGLDAYRKILELHPNQKAIITSGFSETERVKEAKNLGGGQYIRKPYTMEKIGSAIREELEKSS
jgi:PAS domain S-box-containing protein